MMIPATHVRAGMVIKSENVLYKILVAEHRTPGNLRAFIQLTLKKISDGSKAERRLSTSEKVEKIFLDNCKMQYLYNEGDMYTFMDLSTYEQLELHKDILEDAVYFLLPNCEIKIDLYEGKAVGIELPGTVDLTVIETDPNMKSATATSSYKPAKLETGISVQVPQFINVGDVIRVDTNEKKYLERAK